MSPLQLAERQSLPDDLRFQAGPLNRDQLEGVSKSKNGFIEGMNGTGNQGP